MAFIADNNICKNEVNSATTAGILVIHRDWMLALAVAWIYEAVRVTVGLHVAYQCHWIASVPAQFTMVEIYVRFELAVWFVKERTPGRPARQCPPRVFSAASNGNGSLSSRGRTLCGSGRFNLKGFLDCATYLFSFRRMLSR